MSCRDCCRCCHRNLAWVGPYIESYFQVDTGDISKFLVITVLGTGNIQGLGSTHRLLCGFPL